MFTFAHVIKRDGTKVPFDINKIVRAIHLAFTASNNQVENDYCFKIAKEASTSLAVMKTEPTIEEIQDAVILALNIYSEFSVAQHYILYREQRARLRESATTANLDLMDGYLDKLDWRVRENSNMGFSLQGLNNFISSDVTALYWLSKIYNPAIKEAHLDGDLHLHDLNLLAAYCVGWDLQDLLREGFKGIAGNIESAPPKHFRAALGQLVNFFYTLQGEAAGAQAVSSFDTLLAPFIRHDNLDYTAVKQALQEFVFNINIPTRVGFQTPFTNITLDMDAPSTLRDMPVVIGGKDQDTTYGEYQVEMDMLNKAFAEVMMQGDNKGRVFTFPIPTYNITKDFDWDSDRFDGIWKMTGKYGIPYFANYVNSDMSPDDARSMCPLPADTEVIVRKVFVASDGSRVALTPSIKKMKSVVEELQYSEFQAYYAGKWSNITNGSSSTDTTVILKLSNNISVELGRNHLQPVRRDEEEITVKGSEIIITDILPFNTSGGSSTTYAQVLDIHNTTKPQTLYCFEIDNEKQLFMLANGLVTHNCRIRLDNRVLRKRGGGLFGANPLTGSIGVVTINLPRLGILSETIEEFKEQLDKLLNLAKNSLSAKRKEIERFTEGGLYPYTTFYLRDVKTRTGKYWTNHFATIGHVGMNEACLNLLDKDISTPEGQAFAQEIMHFMRDQISSYQEETGDMYNLEATPAEGTSYRLARLDHGKYGTQAKFANTVAVQEGAAPFYTNSTHLPVGHTTDMFEALELQDELQSLYTGGTVFHGFIGEEITDIAVVKNLVRKVTTNFKLPYFSVTPTFSICTDCGYLKGEVLECPTCGNTTDVYSRVVGYLRPVVRWNDGKQQEYLIRSEYLLDEAELEV